MLENKGRFLEEVMWKWPYSWLFPSSYAGTKRHQREAGIRSWTKRNKEKGFFLPAHSLSLFFYFFIFCCSQTFIRPQSTGSVIHSLRFLLQFPIISLHPYKPEGLSTIKKKETSPSQVHKGCGWLTEVQVSHAARQPQRRLDRCHCLP